MHVKGAKDATSKIGPSTSGYATKNMPLLYIDYFKQQELAKQQIQEDGSSEFPLSA